MLALLTVAAPGCNPATAGPNDAKAAAKPPVVVKVGVVSVQSVPVELSGVGTVESITTIQVRAQVPGELTQIHFKEGERVEKGQLLFTIDPRPYQVALAQAEANVSKMEAMAEQTRAQLTRDKAQADNAQAELERDRPLLPKGMVSKEEFESVRTNAEALKAVVAADAAGIKSAVESVRSAKVAIDNAQLQLEYCTIHATTTGLTGSLLVHAGNVILAANPTPLVTIKQIAPINVTFSLPERNLDTVRASMAKGPVTVKALPQGDETIPVEGAVSFVDNEVNQDTGTIRLKALFPNDDARLWPGQFVRVVVQVAVQADATVVPARAVQTGQKGTYVYVIKPGMTAELRPVTTGDSHEEVTVVKEGLTTDEQVVTDGHVKLMPGATVKIADEKAAGDNK